MMFNEIMLGWHGLCVVIVQFEFQTLHTMQYSIFLEHLRQLFHKNKYLNQYKI